MSIKESSVSNHYELGGLFQKITDGLELAAKDLTSLTVDDLAPVDAFHTRGRESTNELASMAELKSSTRVLDVGCGLGGSARYLANTFGCAVTGVDLTNEYIEVAKQLTSLVELKMEPVFQQGSALDLPTADDCFDVVWTEHAQMNITDKDRFYAEISRVLKPGGKLLFHDIFGGESGPTYPLPWAEDESISALATESLARKSMETAGLSITRWENKVEQSLEFFHNVLEKLQANGTPPLGIHLLMGDSARCKLENYVASMSQGQLSVVLGICEKF